MGFIWNKESLEVATRMWSTGSSAGKIAEYFGIGRGAVMGKLSRLGLIRDPNRTTKDKVERGAKKPQPKAEPAPLIPEPTPLHVTFIDLQHGQCKWPYGDSPFTFCGHPIDGHADHPERPYCSHHQQRSVFRKDS